MISGVISFLVALGTALAVTFLAMVLLRAAARRGWDPVGTVAAWISPEDRRVLPPTTETGAELSMEEAVQ